MQIFFRFFYPIHYINFFSEAIFWIRADALSCCTRG